MEKIKTFDSLPNMVYELKEKMDYFTSIVESLKPVKEQNKLLTIEEAAELLDLKVSTIYSKVNKNELPFMKKGKKLYFFKNELLSYVKSGRIPSIEEMNDIANNYITLNSKK